MKRIPNGMGSRLFGGVVVTAALLVPLAVFGGPALARSTAAASEYQYSGSGSAQYQYRVTICHLTGSKKHPFHSITVSSAAVAAHLRHGDHIGACTGTETVRPKHNNGHKPATGTTTSNGKGKGHGNSNSNGHGKGK